MRKPFHQQIQQNLFCLLNFPATFFLSRKCETVVSLVLASILFIFGPSCGGKSTLAKALVQQLGPPWIYLDRDQLIEDGLCMEEKADEMIEECIDLSQLKDQHVIVDAQIPWRAPKKENELYILVYAPLSELLARDTKRTAILNRSPKRAYFARLYVEETFIEVFKTPARLNFYYDLAFDSSQYSIDAEIEKVLQLLLQRKCHIFPNPKF